MREINDITDVVIAEALRIHRRVGPGAFESAYEELLYVQLRKRGLGVERQLVLPFEYEGTRVELGYRLDLLIDQRVIVEVKSTERPAVVHHRQLLTYLRLSGLQVGLLINFGMDQLRQGISRVVNNYGGEKVTKAAP
jgi:iron complex transport system substrate-binding protein